MEAEGYRSLLDVQRREIDELKRQLRAKNHSEKTLNGIVQRMRQKLDFYEGSDHRLPPPGLGATGWWEQLVYRLDPAVFNAGVMSRARGAPSQASLYRLAKSLDFKGAWIVSLGADAGRPQKWHTLHDEVGPAEVAQVLEVFKVNPDRAVLRSPEGETYVAGQDYEWTPAKYEPLFQGDR